MTLMQITTEYGMDQNDRVNQVTWKETAGGQTCTATIIPDNPGMYEYQSMLLDDKQPVVAPAPMSLIDCILSANLHLGMIPPCNELRVEGKSIPCDNQH